MRPRCIEGTPPDPAPQISDRACPSAEGEATDASEPPALWIRVCPPPNGPRIAVGECFHGNARVAQLYLPRPEDGARAALCPRD